MKICLSHNVFYFWEGFLDTSFPGVIPFQEIVGIDIDGFELHVGLLSRRKICLGGLAEALKPFTKYSLNSVHVNMTGRWKDTPEEEKNHFSVFMKTLRNIIFPQYVVFHPNSLMPNIISSLDEIKSILPSMKIALENEDSLEKFGNSPNDFLDLMKSFPDLGLVVDTAHCQALDENMELASFIKHPILRKKIVSIHVGLCSNRYLPSLLEGLNMTKANHLLPCVDKNFPSDIDKVEISQYRTVIEGIVPPGCKGLSLLNDTVNYMRSWTNLGSKNRLKTKLRSNDGD